MAGWATVGAGGLRQLTGRGRPPGERRPPIASSGREPDLAKIKIILRPGLCLVRFDQRTGTYLHLRMSMRNGPRNQEILRCLKCYIVRVLCSINGGQRDEPSRQQGTAERVGHGRSSPHELG